MQNGSFVRATRLGLNGASRDYLLIFNQMQMTQQLQALATGSRNYQS